MPRSRNKNSRKSGRKSRKDFGKQKNHSPLKKTSKMSEKILPTENEILNSLNEKAITLKDNYNKYATELKKIEQLFTNLLIEADKLELNGQNKMLRRNLIHNIESIKMYPKIIHWE